MGKLKSLEEAQKDELRKENNLLSEQLATKTTEVESLRAAQNQLVRSA